MTALAPSPMAALVPHAGAMVLLERVLRWDDATLAAIATSHLNPCNPLRRDGRLAGVCGVEYALQAAAAHGALRDGGRPQPPGWAASLRDVILHRATLDDPRELIITVTLEAQERFGMVYRFDIIASVPLLAGRFAIALPR